MPASPCATYWPNSKWRYAPASSTCAKGRLRYCLMRLWTVHPRHLDAPGLVALWREALLAQAVLLGRTRGYTRHPQLQRFQTAADPVAYITAYLRVVADEATSRGYAFDTARIVGSEAPVRPI